MHTTSLTTVAYALVLSIAVVARAQMLPIEMEVAAMADAPFGAIQEWGPILAEMNLANFRLRGFQTGDQPRLTATPGEPKRYKLIGLLNRRDQLVLPGAAFGPGDRARLKAFLEELPAREEDKQIDRGSFGLTRPQFEQTFQELSASVDRSTVGLGPWELLEDLAARSKTPIAYDSGVEQRLAAAKPLDGELRGLSLGTVLAAALRKSDLQIAPEFPRGKPLAFRVERFDPKRESWPVGWKSSRVDSQVAPALMKYTVVEIEGFPLSSALEALAPHASVPLVQDERTLERLAYDPFERKVRVPAGKRSIRSALNTVLSQATLANELRVDEGGRPFLWITQWGPESPRAR